MFLNVSNSTLVVPVYPWAVQGTYILDNIVSRSIGGIGILVNLFFVIILSHRNLRHKVYDFLWCRQFTSLLTCLSVAASNGFCFDCEYDSERLAYYSLYIALAIRGLSLASFISDLLLIFNRYFKICRKTTFLGRISKKWNLFICYSFSFIACLPAFLAIYVVKVPLNGNFKLTLNVFGASIYYKLYLFLTFLIEIVIPLFTLLLMNSVSIFKFKRVIERYADLTGNQIKARKVERRFTRMVFYLSAITSVTRIIDMVTSIFIRISVISPSTFEQGTLELILFSKSISVILINIGLAFDALVYLRMDKNIWTLILSYTGRSNRVFFIYF
jgi:hypothetical protein